MNLEQTFVSSITGLELMQRCIKRIPGMKSFHWVLRPKVELAAG